MTQAIRSGIPTTYAYGNMRSRLEARWAAFFDLIGWSWVYEPLDCDGYIPDFLIKGDRPVFIEVGPCITKADYEEKSAKPDRAQDQLRHDVLVVGVDPLVDGDHAGWLAESRWYDDFQWGWGRWHHCAAPSCNAISIHHEIHSFESRPCGHADGDHYLGGISQEQIRRLWAEAGNAVQWRPSR